jgi:phytoene dehydrogenase-like protein
MKHDTSSTEPVLIVGAGMAGLSCAIHLQRAGIPFRIYESSDGVGGRVRTDQIDGFLLDRGFQVYLDTYPVTGNLLDLKALDLRAFEPGALVFNNGKLHRLMDVFRRPFSVWSSAVAPIGGVIDKLRVGLLRTKILCSSFARIANRDDLSTEAYLKKFGFSDRIIDDFFRAFYGGIFLERELHTSSRMFEFTFKLFGRGSATIPAKGMAQIPQQLAAQLPSENMAFYHPVVAVEPTAIEIEGGERISGRAVVLATNATRAGQLLPSLQPSLPKWRSVTNLYFAADRSPIDEAIICLNGSGSGLVNNVCVLTDAAPDYAPAGQSLMSVSLLGLPKPDSLVTTVKDELVAWFGASVNDWQHLRTDCIQEALPEQLPNAGFTKTYLQHEGLYVCGDHRNTASIEGAVVSGKHAAEAIIRQAKEA